MWENTAGAIRYSRPRGFNIAGASAPVAPAVPTPLLGNMRQVGIIELAQLTPRLAASESIISP